MDISVIIKKTLVFAGLFAASYAVLASFAYLGSVVFENVIRNRWIAMVPSVVIVVLILNPLEKFLRNVTDKFLFQKRYDYKQLLRVFTDEVLTVLDLDRLINFTVHKLTDVMKLENAAILLQNEEIRMAVSNDLEIPGDAFKDREKLKAFIRKSSKYVLFDGPRKERIFRSDIAKEIIGIKASLVIPLTRDKNEIGILLLWKKKSDENFAQDDIDILLPLARTLSIAITNARLFKELSEAQAQAAQREKMAVIGTLSAGINHEICNPLGIARGQCEMFLLNLKEGLYNDKSPEELMEKAQEIMSKVMAETDRATVITKRLSTFAKPAKGMKQDDLYVEDVLDEVITLVEHDLNLENITISKNVEKDLPCISADYKQMQEIFFNIIMNAGQAMEGEGDIIVDLSSAGGKVYIDIKDTGPGISESHLMQIFNPFFTTKAPGKGTGLGLFIVKQIIEKNGGSILVQSEVGKGTTFRLIFDAVKPDHKGTDETETGAGSSGHGKKELSKSGTFGGSRT